MAGAPDDAREIAQNWGLINTPLGEEWSGRARYAAAMFFFARGEISADTLEVYRVCSRLDSDDPLAILEARGSDKAWLARMGR